MQINPFTNNVTSVWRTNINVARKYNYYRKGRKYVKKVSENIINLLKIFGYKFVNESEFFEFLNDKIHCEILGLVTKKEEEKNEVDESFLASLEDAIDELNDYSIEELDFQDINERLNK